MKRGWIALLAGLSAGALLVCCVAGLVLSFGLVSLPTAGVTQPPVAALTQPPPVPTVPLASPVIVATPTTAPPTERTVSVTALAYNAARAEGSTQRAQVIIRPKSDSIVRVGFLERTAVGIGATWRSAAWTATTAAALMLGVDLSAYDIAFDTGAELIDGPSASGLMTVAVLAGLLGDDVRADAAMTGTINPDGTIGPVGGVPQKIEGAARDGKKLVVVPIVNRNSVDLKSKKTVDVVEWGRNLGVEVRPVSTVYEAYEILTGKKLPRPAGAPRAALSSRATAQFTAATNVLLARYNQEMQRYNALPENIRQGRAESVSSATQSAQTCSKYLAQGLPEIAFQHGFEALSAFVALNASARLDQLYLQGDYPGMVAQAQAAEKALPLNAALDRLKAQTPRTATDAIALMDAYSDQAAAFALTAEGDLLLIGVAKAMPTGKPSEEWLNTLYRANGDFANASVYLELVDQLLTTYIGFGQSSAPSEARAAVMAETLHRAAEANLAYFESILDDNARTLNVDAAKLRGVVFSRDGDYRNAKFSLVGIPFAAQRLGTGPQSSLMKLGSSLNAYAYSAVLIAKYYSLNAQIDKDGTLTGFGQPQGLIDMLSLADQNSASLLALVQAEEPLPALFYYNNARFFREEAAAQKALALVYFWQAAAESQVLANFSQAYAQSIQRELVASNRSVSPLLAWGWRAPMLPPATSAPRALPTVAPSPQAQTTSAPPPPAPPGSIITNAVMARDAKSDTFEPVGVTNTFGAEQAIFHAIVTIANAPSGTVLKTVWTAIDVGSVAPPNTSMGEMEIQVEGSRNVDAKFKPSAGRLPPGTFKVDIYLNGKLDRTLRFSVTSAPTVAPTTAAGCPPLPAPAPKPSGIVASVTMALDATGDTKEPVNPTAQFPASAIFHAIVRLQNAPANTKIGIVWYATDVGNGTTCNIRLGDPYELAADGTRNIDFTLKPKTTWPAGMYRVEILVNGVLDRVVDFSVK